MHGKTSDIRHKDVGVFHACPSADRHALSFAGHRKACPTVSKYRVDRRRRIMGVRHRTCRWRACNSTRVDPDRKGTRAARQLRTEERNARRTRRTKRKKKREACGC
jgi:hypothetical protein